MDASLNSTTALREKVAGLGRSLHRVKFGALLASAVTLALAGPAAAKTTLRIATTQDLRIVDPTYGGGDVTGDLGFAAYDTLFGFDEQNVPRPQMVETYTMSDDGLVYTFKLRPNLKFHTGQAVTSKDVAASVNRWVVKSISGRVLGVHLDRLETPDDRTIVIKLKKPYAMLIESLCTMAGISFYVLPEALASIDPNKMVETVNGSGPFKFEPSRWVLGSSWVFSKNEGYVPRDEPPNGGAGGKLAKVDEVEYRYFGDPATAVNALVNGEVDMLNGIPYELLPLLEINPDIKMETVAPLGDQIMLRPNFLYPPFDNVKMRQALFYLIDPKELLTAAAGEEKYITDCISAFICGAGQPPTMKVKLPDVAKAKALIKEAGYNGAKIIFLNANDQSELSRISTVLTERMKAVGLNVEQQDMDWGTMVTRRASKDNPAASPSGWNLFITSRPGVAAVNPILNSALDTSCEQKNWFGWPCDEEIERLRAKYLTAATRDEQMANMEEINKRFIESLPYVPIGKILRPTVAARLNVTGFLPANRLVPWNISMTKP